MIAESLNIPMTVVIWILKQDFCSRDFFLLHDDAPVHKAVSVGQFLTPQKCYNRLSPPVRSRVISSIPFSVPKLKMTFKGLHCADVAELEKALTDELKKVQKEEFSADFQKLYDRTKACIYANGVYFE
jgi:hypothetical protein